MGTRLARALVVTLLAAVAMGMQSGCQSKRGAQERAELYRQNQELQDELDRARAARDAAMAQPQSAPAPAPAPVPQTPAAANTGFSGIGGIEVEQGYGNIRVKVPGDVLFASGKADLTTAARSTLGQVVAVIRREYSTNRIIVEGHTDSDPIKKSKWASNQQLSEARAQSVADFLAQQGVSSSRITTAGYGSSQPRETKAKSRRVEIVVLQ